MSSVTDTEDVSYVTRREEGEGERESGRGKCGCQCGGNSEEWSSIPVLQSVRINCVCKGVLRCVLSDVVVGRNAWPLPPTRVNLLRL
jgi:hypothetical protein